ncbi:hypothetical protein PRIPAC_78302 [Pristionchus pacificus]|nr:hypothetical protein PRIPAC_78302 [Pristionchus pacificus]
MRSILQKDYSREPKFHVSARELEMYDQKKGGKFLCRSCRFDMCVEIGMTYTIPVRKLQSKRKYSVEVELPTFPSSDLPIVHKESLLELMRVEYEHFALAGWCSKKITLLDIICRILATTSKRVSNSTTECFP